MVDVFGVDEPLAGAVTVVVMDRETLHADGAAAQSWARPWQQRGSWVDSMPRTILARLKHGGLLRLGRSRDSGCGPLQQALLAVFPPCLGGTAQLQLERQENREEGRSPHDGGNDSTPAPLTASVFPQQQR